MGKFIDEVETTVRKVGTAINKQINKGTGGRLNRLSEIESGVVSKYPVLNKINSYIPKDSPTPKQRQSRKMK
jgi:hypothetical protein